MDIFKSSGSSLAHGRIAMFLLALLAWTVALPAPFASVCLAQAPAPAPASPNPFANETNDADLPLSQFRPTPKLRVEQHLLSSAKMPLIDCHSHFKIRLRHDPDALDAFVQLMNRNRIAVSVSLDGGLDEKVDEHIKYLWTKYPNRFAIFANIDWQGSGKADQPETWDCHREDFAHRTVIRLQQAKEKGVCGLKVFKSLGLEIRNPDGSLVRIDDPRWDPIWDACGKLGFPVIMHTADPSAFFDPITPENERYEELLRHPDWHFPAERFPSRQELHTARNNIIARHTHTTFIAAHMANDAEDLQETAGLLEKYPNLVIEIASRISELGRQPYTARDFLIKYQDRVLFGTDGPWPELRYQRYWRFLETRDQFFPYSEKEFPPQGFWQIYGVYLPDDVLEKIYYQNAMRIIPGIREKYQAAVREF